MASDPGSALHLLCSLVMNPSKTQGLRCQVPRKEQQQQQLQAQSKHPKDTGHVLPPNMCPIPSAVPAPGDGFVPAQSLRLGHFRPVKGKPPCGVFGDTPQGKWLF